MSRKRIPQLLALVAANFVSDSLVASVGPGDAAFVRTISSRRQAAPRSMNKTFVEINPEMGPGWPHDRPGEEGILGPNHARLS